MPWKISDQKVSKSHFHSYIGDRKVVLFSTYIKNLKVKVVQMSTAEMCDAVDTAFTKHRNITFHRYHFLMRKPFKSESEEKFWKSDGNCR